MASKTLAFTVTPDVYKWFEDFRDKENLTMSQAIKRYFGLEDNDLIFTLAIDSSDKQWMTLVILSFEIIKVADILLEQKIKHSKKQGYRDMSNVVKKARVYLDNVVDAIAEKNIDINKDLMNRLFDFAIEMRVAIEKASKSESKLDKMKNAIKGFLTSK